MTDLRAIRSQIFETLCGFDSVLVPHGHRSLAPAWRDALRHWLVDGTTRTLVVRKGRRIGASTIICPRLVAAWILTVVPRLALPPGESVLIGLVSIGRNESKDRLPQCSAVLTALGIAHDLKASDDEIVLRDLPVRIVVLTRNWRTAVGRTIGVLWCDELSRWESGDQFENPSAAVVSSLMPSLMTFPESLAALVSSPWGLTDYHAQRYDMGDTPAQTTAFLPSWIGNPTLSEQALRFECPNVAEFMREYAGVPSAELEHLYFDLVSVRAARARRIPAYFEKQGHSHLCIDASAGHVGGDPFGWISCSWWRPDPLQCFVQVGIGDNQHPQRSLVSGEPIRRKDCPLTRPILRIEFADRLMPPFHNTVDSLQLAQRIVDDGARFLPAGARQYVHMDQFSEHAYKGIFATVHARSVYHPLTATSKGAACTLLRQWLDDGTICIDDSPAADALVYELEHYQQVMTSGGSYRYSAPVGQHDDLVACLLQSSLSMQDDNRYNRIGWCAARGVIK